MQMSAEIHVLLYYKARYECCVVLCGVVVCVSVWCMGYLQQERVLSLYKPSAAILCGSPA